MRRALPGLILMVAACTTSTTGPAGATQSPGAAGPTSQSNPTSAPIDVIEGPSDGMVCWTAEPPPGSATITFSDITAEVGLVEPLTGMHGHAAAWGDVNGDNRPDLVVGTFANRPFEKYQVRGADGPSPDTLLVAAADGSYAVESTFPPILGRTSGAVIIDIDHDGDRDVLLSRNMRDRERGDAPTQIYRNDGGTFSLVDVDLGRLVSGRSIGILDFDQDGLLDILLVEDRFGGDRSSMLLRNEGGMVFSDVSQAAGIPEGLHGLGIATSDLNGDGATDFFVGGANRLFIATDSGFTEATDPLFTWDTFGNEDDAAGVSIADLNRDGLPDLVVGHHYNSTLSQNRSVPIRVYLNTGNDDQEIPRFVDVTSDAGIEPLPTKAPHVEIADLDNDGWPDILTTASADGGESPAVFRNLGGDRGGTPTFSAPTGLGSAQYWVAGPTADVDRDGRLDVLLVEWEPTLPSLLLRNESDSGKWLEVTVSGSEGIGTTVWVWEAGRLDDLDALLGMREIVVSQGYTSGNLPVAHFGLGETAAVDVRIVSPDGTSIAVTDVGANQHIRIPGGC